MLLILLLGLSALLDTSAGGWVGGWVRATLGNTIDGCSRCYHHGQLLSVVKTMPQLSNFVPRHKVVQEQHFDQNAGALRCFDALRRQVDTDQGGFIRLQRQGLQLGGV